MPIFVPRTAVLIIKSLFSVCNEILDFTQIDGFFFLGNTLVGGSEKWF